MTHLHPDVQVYVKKVSDFFKKSSDSFEQIFGDHSFGSSMGLVEEYAIQNQKESGEPQLRPEQFREARKRLDRERSQKGLFLPMKGWTPICLN